MEKLNQRKLIDSYIKKYRLNGVIKDEFLERIELHKYKKGEIIYYMEEEFRHLYFLVEGRILVHLNTFDGKEMYLDFGEPLEILGDIEFISSSGVYSNVEAIKDSYLLALPRELLKENARNNSEFYEVIAKFLGNKLVKTSKKYTEMILYPLKDRIATYLYMIGEDEGMIEGFKQEDLALSYGISDRHLRRILGELEEEGIIKRMRGRIEIVDVELLKKYCIQ